MISPDTNFAVGNVDVGTGVSEPFDDRSEQQATSTAKTRIRQINSPFVIFFQTRTARSMCV